jgi:hypothetical protein
VWRLLASDRQREDILGYEITISGDGNTVLASVDSPAYFTDDESGSVYVFVRDGTSWREQAILVASDGVAKDSFGRSMSLSGDGNTALIGSENNTAYIFVRNGETWTQQAKITSSEPTPYPYLGGAVRLSSDGNSALILAPGDILHQTTRGAVYIFTRDGDVWTQQTALVDSHIEADEYFGIPMSLSGDGSTAMITTLSKSPNPPYGLIYTPHIFVRSDVGWIYQTTLTINSLDGNSVSFREVRLDNDGDTLVIGNDYQNVGQKQQQGAAYVFIRNAGTWVQQSTLIASDGEVRDYFGSAVSINGDGDTILVGAYGDDEMIPGEYYPFEDMGSAYIFTRSGENWTQQRKLTPFYPQRENSMIFGIAVELSDDAKTAAIGSPFDSEGNLGIAGAVWVFSLP